MYRHGMDTYIGTPDDDLLKGTEGRDRMAGKEGDDTLQGEAGRDTLIGGSGDDRLAGGRDNDLLRGGLGSDTLIGGGGADTLYGEQGHDHLRGGGGDDVLHGGADERLFGELGNDLLQGGARMYGGLGNDTLIGIHGGSTVDGGGGNDLLIAITDPTADGKYELYGWEGADTLQGSDAGDKLNGGSGNDLMEGGDGDDFLLGSQGEDQLIGGAGNDTLVGSSDYDVANGDAGNDVIVLGSSDNGHTADGGEGIDILRAAVWGHPDGIVYVNDDPNLVKELDGHQVTGFERIDFQLGSYDDSVIGGDHATIFGSWGNDTLQGSVLTGAWDADSLTGTAGNDQISGDNFYVYDDTIYGAAGNDRVDDEIGAGAGILSGGAGRDSLWLRWHTDQDLQIVNDPDAVQTILGNTISGFEIMTLWLGTGDDSVSGGGRDSLYGEEGNDTLAGHVLEGSVGDDLLIGMGDGFSMRGGAGADLFEFGDAAGSVRDYAQGVDKLSASQAIGDGDAAVEGAVRTGGPGGFGAEAELVIVTADIAGAIDAASAAAAIGSAGSAYAEGRTVLFVVDDGSDSALYRFVSSGVDAAVSAAELSLMATIEGVSDTAIGDYLFRPA